MAQGVFKIELDEQAKMMRMLVGGTFSKEDYANFIHDYETKTAMIDAKSYALKVDCRTMDLLSSGEVESLKGSFQRYVETGFHEVIFVITDSQVFMKMQLKRVAKSAGLDQVEVIIEA